MRKIGIILSLIGLVYIYSCERDPGVVLDTGDFKAPSITSPTDASSIVLTADAEDSTLIFTWETADYGLDLATTYYLEADHPDSNFVHAVEVLNSIIDSAEISMGDFNLIMLEDLGLPFGEESNVEMRVRASVNENVNDLVSSSVTLAVTPYSTAPPPPYILGNGTRAGWNNNNALEMLYQGDGVFYIIDSLFSGTDVYIKFIAELGKWAPQWGQESGTWDQGTLKYRPTDSDPDPPAIPAPPTSGIYKVTFDSKNLTYSVEEAGLFILGDATTAGWDNNAALPMSAVDPFRFSIITDLTGGAMVKFISKLGSWQPQYGGADGELQYQETPGDPEPPPITVSGGDGTYRVTADIKEMTYSIEAVK